MNYTLKDLLDVPKLQALLDTLDEIHSLPSAIIDADGNILTATAWQDICTKFHRTNPETEKKCRESDSFIAGELCKNSPAVVCKCPLGLVDTATPIIVDGQRLGGAFAGQVFTEPPDGERFIQQARQYGFDEAAYLEAMRRVPVISEERLRKNLNFLGRFTEMLAGQGLLNKRHLEGEEALRESRERYRMLFDNSPICIHEIDMDGRIASMNKSGLAMMGLQEESQVRGLVYLKAVCSADRERIGALLTRAYEGETSHFEFQSSSPLRQIFKSCFVPVRNKREDVERVIGITSDITERKQAEDSLRESEKRYRTLFSGAGDGIFTVSLDGKLIEVNESIARMHGYTVEEMRQLHLKDLDTPETAQMIPERMRRLLEGENLVFEVEHYHKDGHVFPLEVLASRVALGELIYIQCFHRDISERRRREKISQSRLTLTKYAASHSLDELLTRTIDEAEAITGSSIGFFHFLEADQRTLSLQAWSTNTLQNMCSAAGKGSHYPLEKAGVWVDCIRQGCSVIHNDYEGLLHKKGLPEGHTPVIRELVVPVRRSGIIAAVLGVGNKKTCYVEGDVNTIEQFADFAWDVIGHKVSEGALRESESRYRRIIEGLTDYQYSVRVKNSHAVETVHSPACAIVTGFTAEEFAQDPHLWIRMIPPEDRNMVLTHVQKILDGKDIHPIEHRIIRKDGEVRWVRDNFILFRDATGNLLSYDGVVTDITEHRRLEDQLRQAQKMEAVGLLAGGVAHDFNNMLSAIIGAASMLKMRTTEDSPHLHLLNQILNAAEKSAGLTQQLLAFSRKQIISPRETDLNVLLNKMERLLVRLIGEDIELKISASAEQLIAMVDPVQIEQVLMNLCTNARDSMPDGGVLSVRTEAVELAPNIAEQHGLGKPGRYALVSVSDTGVGMEEEIRQRIFEPFFTTKEIGRGTGLGLSIVYGIIKQHEGTISVQSEAGAGSAFSIYLPLVQPSPESSASAEPDLPLGGTETILLAEDSEEVRVTAGFLLKEFGYRIIEAVDGEDAIRKFIENSEDIDIVILDVIMPKKNGRETAEEMKKIRPDVKVLFTSGYTGDVLHRKGIREDGIDFISKPVMPHDILSKIREMLDHP